MSSNSVWCGLLNPNNINIPMIATVAYPSIWPQLLLHLQFLTSHIISWHAVFSNVSHSQLLVYPSLLWDCWCFCFTFCQCCIVFFSTVSEKITLLPCSCRINIHSAYMRDQTCVQYKYQWIIITIMFIQDLLVWFVQAKRLRLLTCYIYLKHYNNLLTILFLVCFNVSSLCLSLILISTITVSSVGTLFCWNLVLCCDYWGPIPNRIWVKLVKRSALQTLGRSGQILLI